MFAWLWLRRDVGRQVTLCDVNCRSVLVGLAANEKLEGLELNLSCNGLGLTGCQVLETLIADVHCLALLDISDNGWSLCMLSIKCVIYHNEVF